MNDNRHVIKSFTASDYVVHTFTKTFYQQKQTKLSIINYFSKSAFAAMDFITFNTIYLSFVGFVIHFSF